MTDTQMLNYALSSPAVASPLRIDPSQLSPLPSWPASQPMLQESAAMEALACDFPGIGEELVWRIYRHHNMDLAATSAELSSLDSLARTAEVLHNAFPAASRDDIVSAVSDHSGDISAAYVFLAQRFLSSWDPEHTPACLLANATIPSSPPPADFVNPHSDYVVAEAEWWTALLKTKSVRVLQDPLLADDWEPLAQLGSSHYAISPRFSHYVRCLGVRLSAPSEYDTALSDLRGLPSFHRVASWVISNNKVSSALHILPVLLEEGLINPGAAAWLAVAVESHPTLSALLQPFFIAFPRRSASVWDARNKFLHLFADVQKARRVLIPPSNDGHDSMVWTASVHDNPPESAAPVASSALSPEISLRHIETRSKGKGKAPSVSSSNPYEIADPARIVKKPKAPAKAPAKKPKKSPPVSKRVVRQSKAAKVIATARAASPLPTHAEVLEPESEEPTDTAVHTICHTRRAVLAAAASIEAPRVTIPPKKKSVRESSSSSLTSP